MYVFAVLMFIFFVSAVYGFIEFYLHQKRVASIPVRIHVNGTRGKSSVTRLIGAALRESGIKTITKVTGTYPRLILDDGSEVAIFRKSDANIIEQLSVVKLAAEKKVQALVVECMAVQPRYQWITEHKMIHSTIGVITNVRLDHVDVMGYSLDEICDSLSSTIPPGKILFTSENVLFDRLKKNSEMKNTKIFRTDEYFVTDDEMNGFNYLEHRENVALVLKVCEHLGISRDVALSGMYKALPDAGALKISVVNSFQKKISFINAFAANDPQSTLAIWEKIKYENKLNGLKIILLNTRQDRLERAKQLSRMVAVNLNNDFDYLILIGHSTEIVEDLSVRNGVKRNKLVNLGWTDPDTVFESIMSLTDKEATVFAIGNMGGMGGKTAEHFENKSLVYD